MEEQIKMAPQTDVEVVDIQFRPGQKIYFFAPDGQRFAEGDHIIIDTTRGEEFGICVGGNHKIPPKNVVAPLRKVLRRATPQDEKTIQENRAKEKRAFEVCQQKIAEHGLDMQLVSAEVAFDGSKILFYFTADERVDFRELVKNLASVFRTRIELRQIGVRDKARMVGGLGICGRPFCCASFLDDFQPVSIKMAKTQNLSLNPTKISGTCGRLMCCLKYEQDAYEDLIRSSPRMDSFVDTPEGRGTVVEVELQEERSPHPRRPCPHFRQRQACPPGAGGGKARSGTHSFPLQYGNDRGRPGGREAGDRRNSGAEGAPFPESPPQAPSPDPGRRAGAGQACGAGRRRESRSRRRQTPPPSQSPPPQAETRRRRSVNFRYRRRT